MATPQLPSTGSIVDFLNVQKKDSSFSARSKIYKDSGLQDRLGTYTGSASQNTNLLKFLQNNTKQSQPAVPFAPPQSSTAPIRTATAQDLFPRGTPTASTASTRPAIMQDLAPKAPVSTPTLPGQPQNQNILPPPLQGIFSQEPQVPRLPTQTTTQPQVQSPRTSSTATPEVSQQYEQTTKQNAGISFSDIYPGVGDRNEADLVNEWLNSNEGKLFLDRQELTAMTAEQKAAVAKQELQAKYQADLETMENNLAERGLAFSGIRGSQVKALADSLAASELQVDREMAAKLLDSDLDLREAILEGVADIVKEASDGEADAIKQLNLIGYAVVGNELVPTLSAERERRIAETGDIYVTTNESGQLTGVSKSTGEVVWRTAGGVGRTGSASPNINVTPIIDPVTGTPRYAQTVNKDTGVIEYTDLTTGQPVPASDVQIEEGADSLDLLIGSFVDEILSEEEFEF